MLTANIMHGCLRVHFPQSTMGFSLHCIHELVHNLGNSHDIYIYMEMCGCQRGSLTNC